ncbi:hypothetical protein DFP73DRAFT_523931 [Morchella snyderi]|nr:hypothetical protein DFP73DRAFT_523931 [Morchella snyderi]
MARGQDERWPHAAFVTLRVMQLMLAPVNPPLSLMMKDTSALYLASTSATGLFTMVYTTTCLIYHYQGKLHRLPLAYIDFGATFLWTCGVALAGYGMTNYISMARTMVGLMEIFLFVATTGIALAAVVRERDEEKKWAKRTVAAGLVPDAVVPGRAEAPV